MTFPAPLFLYRAALIFNFIVFAAFDAGDHRPSVCWRVQPTISVLDSSPLCAKEDQRAGDYQHDAILRGKWEGETDDSMPSLFASIVNNV